MKHIGLLLHFYQPPTQDPETVIRIDEECYMPLFSLLERAGEGVTVNMNLSLTEQLEKLAPETLQTVSRLRHCSFTASGAYHPIFPLVPAAEASRQLGLNDGWNERLIGEAYRPTGVFPPEMALNAGTAEMIGSLGYSWTITDDVPWVFEKREVPSSWIPSVKGTGVFLRSNFWSNRISFHGGDGSKTADVLADDLDRWAGSGDSYLVIAMDGETFGHHRRNAVETFLEPFLRRISARDDIRVSTFDELLDSFPMKEVDIPPGSWSTTPADLQEGEPFPLWNRSGNENHSSYWKFLNFVLENYQGQRAEGVAEAVDKMLYSCPLWWASTGRESYSQVRRGILMILEAALAGIPRGELLDRVMELAGGIPAMAGRDR